MRKSKVAGVFYPKEKTVLKKQIHSYFLKTTLFNHHVKGIIAPHAGYLYCGQQLAEVYASLKKTNIKTAVIIGPSHYYNFKGFSIYHGRSYEIPFGQLLLNNTIIKKLKKKNNTIKYHPEAHKKEHSIEVQLPFLYYLNKHIDIIPIITGNNELTSLKTVAKDIYECIDKQNTIIIASTDFSHFFPRKKATQMDKRAVDLIINYQTETIYRENKEKKIQLCGNEATIIMLEILKKWKIKHFKHFSYSDSAVVTGQENTVVGYNSMSAYE